MAWTSRYSEKWPRLTALFHLGNGVDTEDEVQTTRFTVTDSENPTTSYKNYRHPDDIGSGRSVSQYSMQDTGGGPGPDSTESRCRSFLGAVLLFSVAGLVAIIITLTVLWSQPHGAIYKSAEDMDETHVTPSFIAQKEKELNRELCNLMNTMFHKTVGDKKMENCSISLAVREGHMEVNFLVPTSHEFLKEDIDRIKEKILNNAKEHDLFSFVKDITINDKEKKIVLRGDNIDTRTTVSSLDTFPNEEISLGILDKLLLHTVTTHLPKDVGKPTTKQQYETIDHTPKGQVAITTTIKTTDIELTNDILNKLIGVAKTTSTPIDSKKIVVDEMKLEQFKPLGMSSFTEKPGIKPILNPKFNDLNDSEIPDIFSSLSDHFNFDDLMHHQDELWPLQHEENVHTDSLVSPSVKLYDVSDVTTKSAVTEESHSKIFSLDVQEPKNTTTSSIDYKNTKIVIITASSSTMSDNEQNVSTTVKWQPEDNLEITQSSLISSVNVYSDEETFVRSTSVLQSSGGNSAISRLSPSSFGKLTSSTDYKLHGTYMSSTILPAYQDNLPLSSDTEKAGVIIETDIKSVSISSENLSRSLATETLQSPKIRTDILSSLTDSVSKAKLVDEGTQYIASTTQLSSSETFTISDSMTNLFSSDVITVTETESISEVDVISSLLTSDITASLTAESLSAEDFVTQSRSLYLISPSRTAHLYTGLSISGSKDIPYHINEASSLAIIPKSMTTVNAVNLSIENSDLPSKSDNVIVRASAMSLVPSDTSIMSDIQSASSTTLNQLTVDSVTQFSPLDSILPLQTVTNVKPTSIINSVLSSEIVNDEQNSLAPDFISPSAIARSVTHSSSDGALSQTVNFVTQISTEDTLSPSTGNVTKLSPVSFPSIVNSVTQMLTDDILSSSKSQISQGDSVSPSWSVNSIAEMSAVDLNLLHRSIEDVGKMATIDSISHHRSTGFNTHLYPTENPLQLQTSTDVSSLLTADQVLPMKTDGSTIEMSDKWKYLVNAANVLLSSDRMSHTSTKSFIPTIMSVYDTTNDSANLSAENDYASSKYSTYRSLKVSFNDSYSSPSFFQSSSSRMPSSSIPIMEGTISTSSSFLGPTSTDSLLFTESSLIRQDPIVPYESAFHYSNFQSSPSYLSTTKGILSSVNTLPEKPLISVLELKDSSSSFSFNTQINMSPIPVTEHLSELLPSNVFASFSVSEQSSSIDFSSEISKSLESAAGFVDVKSPEDTIMLSETAPLPFKLSSTYIREDMSPNFSKISKDTVRLLESSSHISAATGNTKTISFMNSRSMQTETESASVEDRDSSDHQIFPSVTQSFTNTFDNIPSTSPIGSTEASIYSVSSIHSDAMTTKALFGNANDVSTTLIIKEPPTSTSPMSIYTDRISIKPLGLSTINNIPMVSRTEQTTVTPELGVLVSDSNMIMSSPVYSLQNIDGVSSSSASLVSRDYVGVEKMSSNVFTKGSTISRVSSVFEDKMRNPSSIFNGVNITAIETSSSTELSTAVTSYLTKNNLVRRRTIPDPSTLSTSAFLMQSPQFERVYTVTELLPSITSSSILPPGSSAILLPSSVIDKTSPESHPLISINPSSSSTLLPLSYSTISDKSEISSLMQGNTSSHISTSAKSLQPGVMEIQDIGWDVLIPEKSSTKTMVLPSLIFPYISSNVSSSDSDATHSYLKYSSVPNSQHIRQETKTFLQESISPSPIISHFPLIPEESSSSFLDSEREILKMHDNEIDRISHTKNMFTSMKPLLSVGEFLPFSSIVTSNESTNSLNLSDTKIDGTANMSNYISKTQLFQIESSSSELRDPGVFSLHDLGWNVLPDEIPTRSIYLSSSSLSSSVSNGMLHPSSMTLRNEASRLLSSMVSPDIYAQQTEAIAQLRGIETSTISLATLQSKLASSTSSLNPNRDSGMFDVHNLNWDILLPNEISVQKQQIVSLSLSPSFAPVKISSSTLTSTPSAVISPTRTSVLQNSEPKMFEMQNLAWNALSKASIQKQNFSSILLSSSSTLVQPNNITTTSLLEPSAISSLKTPLLQGKTFSMISTLLPSRVSGILGMNNLDRDAVLSDVISSQTRHESLSTLSPLLVKAGKTTSTILITTNFSTILNTPSLQNNLNLLTSSMILNREPGVFRMHNLDWNVLTSDTMSSQEKYLSTIILSSSNINKAPKESLKVQNNISVRQSSTNSPDINSIQTDSKFDIKSSTVSPLSPTSRVQYISSISSSFGNHDEGVFQIHNMDWDALKLNTSSSQLRNMASRFSTPVFKGKKSLANSLDIPHNYGSEQRLTISLSMSSTVQIPQQSQSSVLYTSNILIPGVFKQEQPGRFDLQETTPEMSDTKMAEYLETNDSVKNFSYVSLLSTQTARTIFPTTVQIPQQSQSSVLYTSDSLTPGVFKHEHLDWFDLQETTPEKSDAKIAEHLETNEDVNNFTDVSLSLSQIATPVFSTAVQTPQQSRSSVVNTSRPDMLIPEVFKHEHLNWFDLQETTPSLSDAKMAEHLETNDSVKYLSDVSVASTQTATPVFPTTVQMQQESQSSVLNTSKPDMLIPEVFKHGHLNWFDLQETTPSLSDAKMAEHLESNDSVKYLSDVSVASTQTATPVFPTTVQMQQESQSSVLNTSKPDMLIPEVFKHEHLNWFDLQETTPSMSDAEMAEHLKSNDIVKKLSNVSLSSTQTVTSISATTAQFQEKSQSSVLYTSRPDMLVPEVFKHEHLNWFDLQETTPSLSDAKMAEHLETNDSVKYLSDVSVASTQTATPVFPTTVQMQQESQSSVLNTSKPDMLIPEVFKHGHLNWFDLQETTPSLSDAKMAEHLETNDSVKYLSDVSVASTQTATPVFPTTVQMQQESQSSVLNTSKPDMLIPEVFKHEHLNWFDLQETTPSMSVAEMAEHLESNDIVKKLSNVSLSSTQTVTSISATTAQFQEKSQSSVLYTSRPDMLVPEVFKHEHLNWFDLQETTLSLSDAKMAEHLETNDSVKYLSDVSVASTQTATPVFPTTVQMQQESQSSVLNTSKPDMLIPEVFKHEHLNWFDLQETTPSMSDAEMAEHLKSNDIVKKLSNVSLSSTQTVTSISATTAQFQEKSQSSVLYTSRPDMLVPEVFKHEHLNWFDLQETTPSLSDAKMAEHLETNDSVKYLSDVSVASTQTATPVFPTTVQMQQESQSSVLNTSKPDMLIPEVFKHEHLNWFDLPETTPPLTNAKMGEYLDTNKDVKDFMNVSNISKSSEIGVLKNAIMSNNSNGNKDGTTPHSLTSNVTFPSLFQKRVVPATNTDSKTTHSLMSNMSFPSILQKVIQTGTSTTPMKASTTASPTISRRPESQDKTENSSFEGMQKNSRRLIQGRFTGGSSAATLIGRGFGIGNEIYRQNILMETTTATSNTERPSPQSSRREIPRTRQSFNFNPNNRGSLLFNLPNANNFLFNRNIIWNNQQFG